MQPLQINSEFIEWILIWVGFGSLVAMIFRGIAAGVESTGVMKALLYGIFGTFIGCAVLWWFKGTLDAVRPGNLEGFSCGLIGALFFLTTNQMFGGYQLDSDSSNSLRARRRRRRRRVANFD